MGEELAVESETVKEGEMSNRVRLGLYRSVWVKPFPLNPPPPSILPKRAVENAFVEWGHDV